MGSDRDGSGSVGQSYPDHQLCSDDSDGRRTRAYLERYDEISFPFLRDELL